MTRDELIAKIKDYIEIRNPHKGIKGSAKKLTNFFDTKYKRIKMFLSFLEHLPKGELSEENLDKILIEIKISKNNEKNSEVNQVLSHAKSLINYQKNKNNSILYVIPTDLIFYILSFSDQSEQSKIAITCQLFNQMYQYYQGRNVRDYSENPEVVKSELNYPGEVMVKQLLSPEQWSAIGADGKVYIMNNYPQAAVIAVTNTNVSGAEIQSIHLVGENFIACFYDGMICILNNKNEVMRVKFFATQEALVEFNSMDSRLVNFSKCLVNINSINFLSNEKMALASFDDKFQIWGFDEQINCWSLQKEIIDKNILRALFLDKDKIVSYGERHIKVWSMQSGECINNIKLKEKEPLIMSLAILPASKGFVCHTESNFISIYDSQLNKKMSLHEKNMPIITDWGFIKPDTMVTSHQSTDELRVWDLQTVNIGIKNCRIAIQADNDIICYNVQGRIAHLKFPSVQSQTQHLPEKEHQVKAYKKL